MNRRSKIVLGAVAALSFLIVASFVGLIGYAYLTNRTYTTTLASDLNVSSEWTEISSPDSLETRRRVSEVLIALPNYKADRGSDGFEIKLSDGRRILPQIEISDANGTVHKLQHSGFNYSASYDYIVFTPKGGFAEGEYRTLRIRSVEPFKLEKIIWRERNPK